MHEPGRLKLALCAVIALPLAALPACASTVAPPHASTARGGTLRVVDPMTGFPPGPVPNATTLDPQLGGFDTTELDRCCLGRTLLSYNGQPTSKGGADLRPDLAAAMPDVSADGLTWTFRLKTGLHYAPPYQSTEIVSGDFKRAIARTARLVIPPPTFYSVIQGFDEYAAGTTASISGLETPDPRTLVVRLRQAAGDLGYRLSLSFAAPIPPLRRDPGAPFGVYTGHDTGIGGLVVSSGPYMIDGADAADLESPVAQQREPHGFVTGKSVTLVRNPSWSPSSDALRPALADRIVIDFTLDGTQAAAAVDANRADIVMSTDAPPQAPLSEISAYGTDASRGRVEIDAGDGIRYVSLNLAVPPFDDIHVRRAVAYVIDRSALVAAHGGGIDGAATGHIALDSLEDDALLAYDPFRASGVTARLQLASQEMAKSRYDSSHSGHCDSPVCHHVVALTIIGGHHPAAFGTIVRDDLALIGIDLDIRDVPGHTFFQTVGDPTTRTPMAIGWGWRKDYPNGSDFFTQLFTHEAIAAGNGFSLLGATPDELQQWGYGVSSVPSVDDRIDLCLPLVGGAQARCWAALDEYMIEQVIAVLPIVTEGYIEVIPARISAYSFDQAFDLPALDRIAVDP
jgi:peptide/nickel transport system substrate-binding protein